MSLYAELKRRNVIRMAVLYLVGAWLIVQVTETILPIFHTPEWVLVTVVVLLAIGFVPTLVFSWLFELTPDGLKRDAQVPPAESIAPQTARRMDRLILVGLAAAVAIIAADRFWPRESAQPASSPAKAGAAAPLVASAKGTRLVAVLPFRNRSAREEDAFFAEGIHDDLLTQLSKVAALRVISRTSMMRYRDSDKSVPEIARELGAAVVLEGAVQRAGDQVRVNVQLIDGASDVHLWAENYDRALSTENIFAIQADIAQAVASAMQVVLSPAEAGALVAGSTQNLEAYDAYLRGKLLSDYDGVTAERLRAAVSQFDRAVALDPQFADAYAGKTRAQLAGYWYVLGEPSLREEARASLDHAQRLAPDAIETLMAEAYFHYWGQLDYARADATLKRVIQRVPENADAWMASAFVARRDGRFDDAIKALTRALAIDPVNFESMLELASTLSDLGHFERAEELLERGRMLGAADRYVDVVHHVNRGDADGAWAAIHGPDRLFARSPFEAAILTRDAARIALALSPALWPEELRRPPDYPEAYAIARAEGLLVTGEREKAVQLLGEIRMRMQALPKANPARWSSNGYYFPCNLPGMMGDLESVRAAEKHYLEQAQKDHWAARDVHRALAIAFARAGDPNRAMHYLESVARAFGPATYLRFSIEPGLDSVREHPRYLALKAAYETWAAEHGGG